MIRGVHHTSISTPDLDKALAFYRDILGLEVAFEFGWPQGLEIADQITGLKDSSAKAVMLRAGNAFIELFEYTTPQPAAGDPQRPVCDHGFTHLCLDVKDVDAEYERLKAAGMTFHCPPQDIGSGIRTTYGRDPFGNVLELQEVQTDEAGVDLESLPGV